MSKQKIIVAVSGIVLMILFAVGASFYQSAEQEKFGFLAQENAELFVRDHSPTMGDDNAKVYLVEFMDPECESCRRFYPHVKKIMKDYAGKIKLVIRYTPFHGNSKFVIGILEAARKQGKYWEVLNLAFQSQPYWGSHHNPQPQLLWGYLQSIKGLDISKVRTDASDPAIKKIIEQDVADGQKLGVRQTPTFFVNGQRLQRFGYEELVKLVQEEIKKAY